jgi:hypothetical protein
MGVPRVTFTPVDAVYMQTLDDESGSQKLALFILRTFLTFWTRIFEENVVGPGEWYFSWSFGPVFFRNMLF